MTKKKTVIAKPARAAAPVKTAAPTKAEKAYQSTLKEAEALEPGALVSINLDIPHSVSMVLGALPNLRTLRDAIVADLPHHDVAALDDLERYAHAVWFAHLLTLPTTASPADVKVLSDEAKPLRDALLSDAEALAKRGLLDRETVAAVRAGDNSNLDHAGDLVALSAVFSSSWDAIHDKTAATLEEVRRAGELGPELLAALGVRAQAEPSATPAAEMRVRMYTLFVRAYDQNRRAASYLRWDEGDADAFAPSLYKGRGGRGAPAPVPVPQPAGPPAGPAQPAM